MGGEGGGKGVLESCSPRKRLLRSTNFLVSRSLFSFAVGGGLCTTQGANGRIEEEGKS